MNDTELALAGMNMEELLDRLMQNRALLPIFVKKFLEDGTYAALESAIVAEDMQAAESACHTLKGVCGNLALTALFEATQEQLRCFRTNDPARAVKMMDEIAPLYACAVTHMQAWLAAQ